MNLKSLDDIEQGHKFKIPCLSISLDRNIRKIFHGPRSTPKMLRFQPILLLFFSLVSLREKFSIHQPSAHARTDSLD